jgi:hypothetical protein
MRSRNRPSSSSPSTKPSWLPGGWYLHIATAVKLQMVTAPVKNEETEVGVFWAERAAQTNQRLMQRIQRLCG